MIRNNEWLTLALAAILLGLYSGQGALLFLAALLVTLVPLARLWNHWSLHQVRYERRFAEERLFAGETAHLTIEVANEKPLPLLWLRTDDRFPDTMGPLGRALLPTSLPRVALLSHVASPLPFQRLRWEYELPCPQRGFYFFGPVQLRSGDLFGLMESESELPERTRLIVYPRIEPMERLGLPAKEPFGPRRAPVPLFEDPTRPIGTRDYQPGDAMRRVHWKATARTQQLQSRLWEPTESPQWVILLNAATFERYWEGIDRALLERLISIAATLCQHAHDERLPVGLIVNASIPASDQPIRVAPGRSPRHLRALLEALAAVTPYPTGPLDTLLHAESGALPWGATLVVLTAIVSEALQREMGRLRRAGRRLALLSLDARFDEEQAEALRALGITCYRLPATPVPADPDPDADPDAEWRPAPAAAARP